MNLGVHNSFWAWVVDNPQIPLIISEGAKKAGALLSASYVAISLPGIYNGFRTPRNEYKEIVGERYLIPQLEVLATEGREIIFCFDNDSKPETIRNVNNAIRITSKLLRDKGCTTSVMRWEGYKQKGIDDLIAAHGVDLLHQLV